jgi:hypothetical protein
MTQGPTAFTVSAPDDDTEHAELLDVNVTVPDVAVALTEWVPAVSR